MTDEKTTDERESAGDPREVLDLFARLPDAEARDSLVRRFLPLAEYFARRFGGRGESTDDLVQVASLGLLHAIDRFDPERGVQFSTYAAATIVGEIKRHFRDKGWAIRVPRNLQESALRVNRLLVQLWQELGRSPTIAEIADRADLGEEEVLEAIDAVQAYSAGSLDAPTAEGSPAPAESLGGEDPLFALAEGWSSIAPTLRALPARERQILYLRFFEGRTQSEIAKEVGISQMHVSRLLSQTLELLRERAGVEGVEEGAEGE
ncbi:MAG TPA: SigB/SigF/SigG family RNA polymerase sigma factor [Actinomycetota bacterium]|nr:SigB/SigF/SigG family RNA polymerase sigma factor [Actinomycetota bacterium]